MEETFTMSIQKNPEKKSWYCEDPDNRGPPVPILFQLGLSRRLDNTLNGSRVHKMAISSSHF